MTKKLIARFRPQAWVNDFPIDVDGAVNFDATQKVLSLTLDQIRKFQLNNYDSDELASDLPAFLEHSGPFEVDLDLDGWLEENGIDRYKMTQDDLDRLRRQHSL